MSDPGATPDPVDAAYAQAEAVLDDQAARAVRRERVLSAVAAAGAPAERARPRLLWGQARWLAAAGVAGLALLVGLRLYHPTPVQTEPASVATAPAQAPAPATPAPAAPAPPSAAPQPPVPMRGPAPTPEAQSRVTREVQAVPPPVVAAAPPPPAPSPQAALAPPPPSEVVEDVVVTGSVARREAPAAEARMASKAQGDSTSAPSMDAKLRAAADAGRTAELTTLLNQGAAIDARDEDGETALMKAVRANRPTAAALLRRRGASLDLKNRAGLSARDMATAIGDPALNRALGLAN